MSYCIEALEDGDEDLRTGACWALQRLQVGVREGGGEGVYEKQGRVATYLYDQALWLVDYDHRRQ